MSQYILWTCEKKTNPVLVMSMDVKEKVGNSKMFPLFGCWLNFNHLLQHFLKPQVTAVEAAHRRCLEPAEKAS